MVGTIPSETVGEGNLVFLISSLDGDMFSAKAVAVLPCHLRTLIAPCADPCFRQHPHGHSPSGVLQGSPDIVEPDMARLLPVMSDKWRMAWIVLKKQTRLPS
ncbi:MAG: hypothetical protein R3E02_03190 [Blastomonas sp.]